MNDRLDLLELVVDFSTLLALADYSPVGNYSFIGKTAIIFK